MQPIQLQIFDWISSDDKFFQKLKTDWDLRFETYVVLECLTRQVFMRQSGYLLGAEAIDSKLTLRGYTTDKDYEDKIRTYIKKIEKRKKSDYQRALDLADALNDDDKNAINLNRKFGRIEYEPLTLIAKRNADGQPLKPNKFLSYGEEKMLFWKIRKDIEDIDLTEVDFQSDQDKHGGVSKEYLKETKARFGTDGKKPSRYMSEMTKKDYGLANPVKIALSPEQHLCFKYLIGAYYTVFHTFFTLGKDPGESNFRSKFDRFLAEKFEYMLKDEAEKMSEFRSGIEALFDRETIKDRIKGNHKFFDNLKDEAFNTIVSVEFLKDLERRHFRIGD